MRFHLCKDSGGKLEYFLNYSEKGREDATVTSSSTRCARRIWNEISRVLLVSITVGPNGELDRPHITFTDLLLEREWHSASFCVRKPTTILLSVRGFLSSFIYDCSYLALHTFFVCRRRNKERSGYISHCE